MKLRVFDLYHRFVRTESLDERRRAAESPEQLLTGNGESLVIIDQWPSTSSSGVWVSKTINLRLCVSQSQATSIVIGDHLWTRRAITANHNRGEQVLVAYSVRGGGVERPSYLEGWRWSSRHIVPSFVETFWQRGFDDRGYSNVMSVLSQSERNNFDSNVRFCVEVEHSPRHVK